MSSSFYRDLIAGQIVAPRVPTPTVDSPRRNIDYRQYPFGYGASQAAASASSYGTRSGGSGPGPYRGPLDVMGMTRSVEDQFVGAPRALSGAMSTVGLGAAIGFGSAISMRNLQRIESKIAEGEAGYALGMFNNRIIGVSPGLFGGYTLSGVLPEGLTPQQRNQLTSNLLSLREAQDNPKDFAVTPQPTPEPTDEERAARGRENIVYDSQGNPVTVGSGRDKGNYVTTESGQYVSQAELQRQNRAKQAADAEAARQERARAAEAARAQAAAEAARRQQEDDSNREDYGRNEYSVGTSGSSNPADRGGYRMNAKGGRMDMADGGSTDPVQGNGFVDGSPDNYTNSQTVADDEFRRVRPGSFVMNAPMTEKLQEAGLLPKGVDNPAKKSKIKADKGGMIDVALSKGEYVFEPEEAKEIGYDVLNKINNMGKAEVDRRQSMNQGGFAGTDLSRIPPLSLGFRPPINTGSLPEGFVNPQPSMPDTPLPPAFTATEPSTPLPERTSFEQTSRDLLEVLEDNKTSGYVPEGRSKSGVTIGIGFDIGQHSVTDLERMGFSSDIIAKFTPYVNKTGQAAKNALTKDPLSLTNKEVEDVNTIVLRKKYEGFEKRYPKYANIPDEGKRAVMFSAYYGGGLNRYKTFRKEFDQAQNVKRAIKKGLIDIIPRGAAEYNRARKALDWYNDYELENMSRPIPKPNSSATR